MVDEFGMEEKAANDVYTVMLVLAVVFIITAIVLMVMEGSEFYQIDMGLFSPK